MGVLRNKKRELRRLIIANSDIKSAYEAATLAADLGSMDGDRYYVHQALSTAVIVSYARPFSRNRPDGPLGKKWTRFSAHRHQDLHDRMIVLRNQERAHSDSSARRVRIVPPGARLTEFIAPAESPAWTLQAVELPPDVFPDIVNLCADLGNRVCARAYELMDELYGGTGLAFPTEPFDLDDTDDLFPQASG